MQAFIINFGHHTANRLAHRLYFANIGKRISDDTKNLAVQREAIRASHP